MDRARLHDPVRGAPRIPRELGRLQLSRMERDRLDGVRGLDDRAPHQSLPRAFGRPQLPAADVRRRRPVATLPPSPAPAIPHRDPIGRRGARFPVLPHLATGGECQAVGSDRRIGRRICPGHSHGPAGGDVAAIACAIPQSTSSSLACSSRNRSSGRRSVPYSPPGVPSAPEQPAPLPSAKRSFGTGTPPIAVRSATRLPAAAGLYVSRRPVPPAASLTSDLGEPCPGRIRPSPSDMPELWQPGRSPTAGLPGVRALLGLIALPSLVTQGVEKPVSRSCLGTGCVT
jgi:hypothetical protein